MATNSQITAEAMGNLAGNTNLQDIMDVSRTKPGTQITGATVGTTKANGFLPPVEQKNMAITYPETNPNILSSELADSWQKQEQDKLNYWKGVSEKEMAQEAADRLNVSGAINTPPAPGEAFINADGVRVDYAGDPIGTAARLANVGKEKQINAAYKPQEEQQASDLRGGSFTAKAAQMQMGQAGTDYGKMEKAKLDAAHGRQQQQLSQQKQQALNDAWDASLRGSLADFKDAQKRTESIDAQKRQSRLDYFKEQDAMMDMEDRLQKQGDQVVSRMVKSGYTPTDTQLEMVDNRFGLPPGTSKVSFEIAQKDYEIDQEAKNFEKETKLLEREGKTLDMEGKKTDIESKRLDMQLKVMSNKVNTAKDIYGMLDNVPAGQMVTIGSNSYFGTQGTGKVEIDEDGIGRMLIVDQDTGEMRVKNLGRIGKAESGSFETQYDEETGDPYIFNKKTGQYVSSSDSYDISERWTEMIPEGKKVGQCGRFVNQLTGLGVGDSLASKVEKCDPALLNRPEALQPGMTFVQSTSKPWGHIGLINSVDKLPNGRVQLTLTESNWKNDERVSHTRTMFADDPRIKGFADTTENLPSDMIQEGYRPSGPKKLTALQKLQLEESQKEKAFKREKELATFKEDVKSKKKTVTRIDPVTGETITEEVTDKGKPLQVSQVNLISEGKQLGFVLDPLENIIKENKSLFGPFVGLNTAKNPYSKGAKLQDDFSRAAQVIGKFMEGGVLRKEDESKYAKMLPSFTDTPEVAANKLKDVRELLNKKTQQYINDAELGGYDVSQFQKKEKSMTPAAAALEAKKTGASPFSVSAGGRTFTFKSQSELDSFKKEAGI